MKLLKVITLAVLATLLVVVALPFAVVGALCDAVLRRSFAGLTRLVLWTGDKALIERCIVAAVRKDAASASDAPMVQDDAADLASARQR